MNDDLRNSNVENTERNENNGKERPKRSFNFYWIYGIIILVILSINLFNYTGGVVPIDPTEYQKMLDAGDVDRIVVVNEQQVRVYIKKDLLAQPPHKDKIKDSFSGPNTVGPHYVFNIGTADLLKDRLVEGAESHGVGYRYETQDNWGREILNWVLFFGIMIAIWMFVMRRIGGGGGPGGQIFNIGKSRAQVFEGGKSTNVTFNDVAGLAEAKEELQE
ncbi:MAG: ATP-dependent metallopeptidase FtsH/Yme1/Tma family protein, partial [Flavobacteriales bacterium]